MIAMMRTDIAFVAYPFILPLGYLLDAEQAKVEREQAAWDLKKAQARARKAGIPT